MLVKLLTALTSATLTAASLLLAWGTWPGLFDPGAWGPDPARTSPRLGFHAYYVTHNPDGDSVYCNFPYGPSRADWAAGPASVSELRSPAGLARESLAWFLESPEADTWLSSPEARLEFVYPSHDRDVTLRYVPGSGVAWDERIAAWFERFPPTDTTGARAWVPGSYSWELSFGELGEVRGSTLTPPAALAAMRGLIRAESPTEHFGAVNFDLGAMAQTGPRNMACASVDTDDIDELDDLPRRLAAKRRDW